VKRLNEAGLLPELARVSSVSGGSFTSGLLGLRWKNLSFESKVATNLDELVTTPLRAFAHRDVDLPSFARGILNPFRSVGDEVTAQLNEHLFDGATLQDIAGDPDQPEPRFVINATNLQSGVLMRFSKPYLADYTVGQVLKPTIQL